MTTAKGKIYFLIALVLFLMVALLNVFLTYTSVLMSFWYSLSSPFGLLECISQSINNSSWPFNYNSRPLFGVRMYDTIAHGWVAQSYSSKTEIVDLCLMCLPACVALLCLFIFLYKGLGNKACSAKLKWAFAFNMLSCFLTSFLIGDAVYYSTGSVRMVWPLCVMVVIAAIIHSHFEDVMVLETTIVSDNNDPDSVSMKTVSKGETGSCQDAQSVKADASDCSTDSTISEETIVLSISVKTLSPKLRRAFIFLEDEDWAKAIDYFSQIIESEPESAEAYVGRLLAENHISKAEAIPANIHVNGSHDYDNALKYANKELRDSLKLLSVD